MKLWRIYDCLGKEVKSNPVHTMKAHRRNRDIALVILNLCTKTEESGQPHTPAALTPGKRPQYPLNSRLGGL
jgi:hypothetical protein